MKKFMLFVIMLMLALPAFSQDSTTTKGGGMSDTTGMGGMGKMKHKGHKMTTGKKKMKKMKKSKKSMKDTTGTGNEMH